MNYRYCIWHSAKASVHQTILSSCTPWAPFCSLDNTFSIMHLHLFLFLSSSMISFTCTTVRVFFSLRKKCTSSVNFLSVPQQSVISCSQDHSGAGVHPGCLVVKGPVYHKAKQTQTTFHTYIHTYREAHRAPNYSNHCVWGSCGTWSKPMCRPGTESAWKSNSQPCSCLMLQLCIVQLFLWFMRHWFGCWFVSIKLFLFCPCSQSWSKHFVPIQLTGL